MQEKGSRDHEMGVWWPRCLSKVRHYLFMLQTVVRFHAVDLKLKHADRWIDKSAAMFSAKRKKKKKMLQHSGCNYATEHGSCGSLRRSNALPNICCIELLLRPCNVSDGWRYLFELSWLLARNISFERLPAESVKPYPKACLTKANFRHFNC